MKKVYTEENKQEIIEKYKKSKLSKVEFCKKNEISVVTLRAWLKEYENAEPNPTFIEIGTSHYKKSEIELSIDNISIKIDKNTDFDILRNLLKLVKSI